MTSTDYFKKTKKRKNEVCDKFDQNDEKMDFVMNMDQSSKKRKKHCSDIETLHDPLFKKAFELPQKKEKSKKLKYNSEQFLEAGEQILNNSSEGERLNCGEKQEYSQVELLDDIVVQLPNKTEPLKKKRKKSRNVDLNFEFVKVEPLHWTTETSNNECSETAEKVKKKKQKGSHHHSSNIEAELPDFENVMRKKKKSKNHIGHVEVSAGVEGTISEPPTEEFIDFNKHHKRKFRNNLEQNSEPLNIKKNHKKSSPYDVSLAVGTSLDLNTCPYNELASTLKENCELSTTIKGCELEGDLNYSFTEKKKKKHKKKYDVENNESTNVATNELDIKTKHIDTSPLKVTNKEKHKKRHTDISSTVDTSFHFSKSSYNELAPDLEGHGDLSVQIEELKSDGDSSYSFEKKRKKHRKKFDANDNNKSTKFDSLLSSSTFNNMFDHSLEENNGLDIIAENNVGDSPLKAKKKKKQKNSSTCAVSPAIDTSFDLNKCSNNELASNLVENGYFGKKNNKQNLGELDYSFREKTKKKHKKKYEDNNHKSTELDTSFSCRDFNIFDHSIDQENNREDIADNNVGALPIKRNKKRKHEKGHTCDVTGDTSLDLSKNGHNKLNPDVKSSELSIQFEEPNLLDLDYSVEKKKKKHNKKYDAKYYKSTNLDTCASNVNIIFDHSFEENNGLDIGAENNGNPSLLKHRKKNKLKTTHTNVSSTVGTSVDLSKHCHNELDPDVGSSKLSIQFEEPKVLEYLEYSFEKKKKKHKKKYAAKDHKATNFATCSASNVDIIFDHSFEENNGPDIRVENNVDPSLLKDRNKNKHKTCHTDDSSTVDTSFDLSEWPYKDMSPNVQENCEFSIKIEEPKLEDNFNYESEKKKHNKTYDITKSTNLDSYFTSNNFNGTFGPDSEKNIKNTSEVAGLEKIKKEQKSNKNSTDEHNIFYTMNSSLESDTCPYDSFAKNLQGNNHTIKTIEKHNSPDLTSLQKTNTKTNTADTKPTDMNIAIEPTIENYDLHETPKKKKKHKKSRTEEYVVASTPSHKEEYRNNGPDKSTIKEKDSNCLNMIHSPKKNKKQKKGVTHKPDDLSNLNISVDSSAKSEFTLNEIEDVLSNANNKKTTANIKKDQEISSDDPDENSRSGTESEHLELLKSLVAKQKRLVLGTMSKVNKLKDSHIALHEIKKREAQKKRVSKFVRATARPPLKSDRKVIDPNVCTEDLLEQHLEETKLTEQQLENLRDLHIVLPRAVVPLHLIETSVADRPRGDKKKQIEALGVKIKTGIYTKKEDEIILKNWKEFCEMHVLDGDPGPFLRFRKLDRLLSSTDRLEFVRFLAYDLDNRLLCSVYKRFQRLFSNKKINTGQFTPAEDKIIIDYMEKSTTRHYAHSELAKILNRSRHSVMKRWLTILDRGEVRAYSWTDSKVKELVTALLEATGCEDVEKLRNRRIETEEWKRVAQKLNMNPDKLTRSWVASIYSRVFVKDTVGFKDIKEKLILKLCNMSVDDWKCVNWREIAQEFEGFTPQSLRILVNNVFTYHVPETIQSDFKESLKYLKDVVLPGGLLRFDRNVKKVEVL